MVFLDKPEASDLALVRLAHLLAPADEAHPQEILHVGGGSAFRVGNWGEDFALTFTTSDHADSPTLVSIKVPGEGVINHAMSRADAIRLMAHLAEVTR